MNRRRLLLVVAAVIAALGVALVFVYAKGADDRAAKKYDSVEVLTVAPGKTIQPGESIDDALAAGKVVKSAVAKTQVLDGASQDSDPFQGEVALTTLYSGEQLIPAKFGAVQDVEAAATLPIPNGKIAISILVNDDGRVGKFLSPGAQVALIFTDLDEGNQPLSTHTLLDRVTVLAAGTATTLASDGTSESSSGSDGEIQQLLTIAVTQREAEQVRYAEKDGELTAALLNDASKVKKDSGVTKDNLLE
ncbi:Flp pilus assembly protein CpaB [Nocardioides panacisoli]|uniref:Flp pilus assembly protein CpaB n=1 Tax=Nocardioides panacisoli TaxID=627624 RepID=UPI0031D58BD3